MQLSRIDRITRTFDVASLLSELDPASLTGVSVALLPPRTSPTAATVWTAVTFAAPTATATFAGPDAGAAGAVPVAATADLWLMASAGAETEAVKVERITVPDSSSVPILPDTLDQLVAALLASPTSLTRAQAIDLPNYPQGA